MLAALGGALLLITVRADRTADESIDKALVATQSAIDDALTGRSRALLRVTAGLAQVPDYVARLEEAFRAVDRSNLLDQAAEFREQTGAAWALIADANGVLQAWTYDRAVFGDDLSESSLVGLALAGDSTEGIWIEPTETGDVLFQVVGVPVFDPTRAALRGILLTAQRIDEAFAGELKRHTNSSIVFFAVDTLGIPQAVISTLEAGTIDSAVAALDAERTFEGGAAESRVRLSAAGETLVGVVGALRTASGVPVGGYIGLRSREVELAGFTALRRTMLFVFAGGLGLALLAALVVARQITRPLTRLVDATRRVGEGEYSGRIDVGSHDEVGALASAFQQMMRELKAKEELVQYLSSAEGATLALSPAERQQLTSPETQQTGTTGRLSLGAVFADRYEIRQKVGAGGMGLVYRAYDRVLDEQVAIKTLRSELLEAGTDLLERFKQEIRLARRITHRNVVRTHDIGQVGDRYFITMEYVEGTNLKELIRTKGVLPVSVTLTIGKQLCQALEVAHEQGVIHRDIKPQNMVVDARGVLKVMDFGIARPAERPQRDSGLTAAGVVMGTLEYMAPEQLMGGDVDYRTDLYAAGAVLFECVTGRPVFDAPSIPAFMAKHIEEEPENPTAINPEVSAPLADIILRALAKEQTARWDSAHEMRLALEDLRRPAGVTG